MKRCLNILYFRVFIISYLFVLEFKGILKPLLRKRSTANEIGDNASVVSKINRNASSKQKNLDFKTIFALWF